MWQEVPRQIFSVVSVLIPMFADRVLYFVLFVFSFVSSHRFSYVSSSCRCLTVVPIVAAPNRSLVLGVRGIVSIPEPYKRPFALVY